MRLLALFLLAFPVASLQSARGQENKIDVDQFHLEVIDDAEAHASVNTDSPGGQKAVMVVVSKIGLEFWSVELRAPGIKFESGKTYEVKFQAKSTPAQFVYVVPEKTDGNQGSIAEGTTLRIPENWAECTVVFHTTDAAYPGRLTVSSLSANPASYWFTDFSLNEK
jgi:Carbohydrate binding domain